MSAGLKYFERLNYLSELIEKRKTGCATQLANTLQCLRKNHLQDDS